MRLGLFSVLRRALLAFWAACFSLAMVGCGVSVVDRSGNGTLHLQGLVQGGQNPIAGATIGLYTAGTGGLGSAASSMLRTTVTSSAAGTFNLTNDYTCGNATDQVYLTAVGGDPGFGAANAAIVQVVALGDCGNLSSTTFIVVNEVTTAAAAWALAQFSKDYAHIGATSTNSIGMRNAFLDAGLMASSASGTATTLPGNLTTESGKLYALADVLASCVNSTGASSGPCADVFAAAKSSGGSAPTTTFNAALNIVLSPANKVVDVWNCINADAPFPTSLTKAPNDWTMSLTVTGGGLSAPTTVGLDHQGNVWVADYSGLLSGFTAQGTAMSSTGFGAGYLSEVYGLAVDPSGNIWLTNEQTPTHGSTQGSVVKFQGVGGTAGSYVGTYSDSSIDFPEAVAADTNGTIDIANYGQSTATIYDSNGNLIVGGIGGGSASFPVGILADAQHGLWLANSDGSAMTHLVFTNAANPAGGYTATNTACCSSVAGLAEDASGDVWFANSSTASVSEVSSGGALLLNQQRVVGSSSFVSPNAVAIDGAQNVWVLNFRGNSISEVAGNGGSVATGTQLTPDAGLGLDANLSEPFDLLPDASGNLWVTNFANNDVVMFFGLAGPTVTPLQPLASAP